MLDAQEAQEPSQAAMGVRSTSSSQQQQQSAAAAVHLVSCNISASAAAATSCGLELQLLPADRVFRTCFVASEQDVTPAAVAARTFAA
jgi:hypothetical protein